MAWKCPSDPGASLCGRGLHLLDGQGAPEGEPGRTWQEEPQSWIPSGQELRLTKWVCPFGLVNTSDDTVAQNKVSDTRGWGRDGGGNSAVSSLSRGSAGEGPGSPFQSWLGRKALCMQEAESFGVDKSELGRYTGLRRPPVSPA